MKGGNHGGSMRPFGWRKDRIRINKREAAHIRAGGTSHLLSPFVRCGKCGAKVTSTIEKNHRGEAEARYWCPSRGNGGCGWIAKPARPVEECVKALVIAEQQKIGFRTLQEAPPWPGARELTDLQERINEQQRRYEAGQIVNAERRFLVAGPDGGRGGPAEAGTARV